MTDLAILFVVVMIVLFGSCLLLMALGDLTDIDTGDDGAVVGEDGEVIVHTGDDTADELIERGDEARTALEKIRQMNADLRDLFELDSTPAPVSTPTPTPDA